MAVICAWAKNINDNDNRYEIALSQQAQVGDAPT